MVTQKKSNMKVLVNIVPGKVSLGLLTPDKLKELSHISTYSTRDSQSTSTEGHGYQREPMGERFPAIGRFYTKGDNRFRIPPLTCSVRVYNAKQRARFNTLFGQGAIGKIHKEFGPEVFSIVDGQHRMGGLYWAWQHLADFTADVPVMMYYGLSFVEEASMFDDINVNQRKLPKALIEVTRVHMGAGDDSHAQLLREVAYTLATDEDSVWNGQVNMTGATKSPNTLTFEGLRRSVGSMLPVKLVARLESRKYDIAEVVKGYWRLVAEACSDAWGPEEYDPESGEPVMQYRIKELVGVASLSKLGEDVLATALDTSTTVEEFWEKVGDLVEKLRAVDWEKRRDNPYMATSGGFGGQRQLFEILYSITYDTELAE